MVRLPVAPEKLKESAAEVEPSWKPRFVNAFAPPKVAAMPDGMANAAPTPSALRLKLEVTVEPMVREPMAFSAPGPTLRVPPWLTTTGPVKLPVPLRPSAPVPVRVRPAALVMAPVNPVTPPTGLSMRIVRTPAPAPRLREPSVSEPTL